MLRTSYLLIATDRGWPGSERCYRRPRPAVKVVYMNKTKEADQMEAPQGPRGGHE